MRRCREGQRNNTFWCLSRCVRLAQKSSVVEVTVQPRYAQPSPTAEEVSRLAPNGRRAETQETYPRMILLTASVQTRPRAQCAGGSNHLVLQAFHHQLTLRQHHSPHRLRDHPLAHRAPARQVPTSTGRCAVLPRRLAASMATSAIRVLSGWPSRLVIFSAATMKRTPCQGNATPHLFQAVSVPCCRRLRPVNGSRRTGNPQ